MHSVPKLDLVARTAAYHRFTDSPTTRSQRARNVHTSAVRIKHKHPISQLPSEPDYARKTANTDFPESRSASDMFEMIKVAAAEGRSTSYSSFHAHGMKIGAQLSADRGSSRLAHPLLDKAAVLGPPRSLWNEHPLFPPPTQRGPCISYAIGRKNWLREHNHQIRVAQIRRYRS